MLIGYNYHTIPMEKVLQAQAKSCLAKSRNQDEDPCPNLPENALGNIKHASSDRWSSGNKDQNFYNRG